MTWLLSFQSMVEVFVEPPSGLWSGLRHLPRWGTRRVEAWMGTKTDMLVGPVESAMCRLSPPLEFRVLEPSCGLLVVPGSCGLRSSRVPVSLMEVTWNTSLEELAVMEACFVAKSCIDGLVREFR